ncbi:nucleoside deaminase [Pilimelia terevasa]|nr:nucleoside deaminase [Pilimelia terevasa]
MRRALAVAATPPGPAVRDAAAPGTPPGPRARDAVVPGTRTPQPPPGRPPGGADVPVGAVVYGPDGAELAAGRNEREHRGDPTAHAEIVALRAAAARVGGWRLDGCTLVVTLEPCTMCAGAILQARVAVVVFGAWEPKTGAAGSLYDVLRDPRHTHRPEVYPEVLAGDSAALLRDFFGRAAAG